jgi:ABC-type nitrate/sulfonate/bicarbonate transport system substrate-binding protein
MAKAKQPTRITRDLQAMALLRYAPIRSAELAECLGTEPRTTKRIIRALRDAGKWCRTHGLEWYEITTEIRGPERWHRLVDRPAETHRKASA